jgi:amidase/nitrilase
MPPNTGQTEPRPGLAESFTLAAAQAEPVYHDREAAVDRTVGWVERAADAGADLVVFPETFFGGYPYWRRATDIPRWTELMVELQRSALRVGDEAMATISEAIAEAGIHVCLGANELDGRPGSETCYNTMFWFDRDGRLVRRHRKLMPTHGERSIWGRGDPDSLAVHDTDLGRLGGLVCYENHMTLSKAALCSMGEEIHAACWPGYWTQDGHPGAKSRAESSAASDTCDIYPAVRSYAFETGSFVVSCSLYLGDMTPPGFEEGEMGYDLAAGGSMLVNPAGVVREGPVLDEEALLVAEFDRDERRAVKAYFDAMGHYSRWDAVNLEISGTSYEPVHRHDHADTSGDAGRERLDAAEDERTGWVPEPAAIDAIAEEHGLAYGTVETVAEELADRR